MNQENYEDYCFERLNYEIKIEWVNIKNGKQAPLEIQRNKGIQQLKDETINQMAKELNISVEELLKRYS